MWPYPWTHVGTPSHLGHMDRVAATMPSQAHAGAAQEAPDIGQWEGQDVPLVRPSSCNVKGGIPSSRRYLPTYLLKIGGSCVDIPEILFVIQLLERIYESFHRGFFIKNSEFAARFKIFLRPCTEDSFRCRSYWGRGRRGGPI